MTESLKNAQINNGISDLRLTEEDLIVEETKHKAQMSTVLMIDISHSMILYGEDLAAVNMTESLKNAQINNGISDLRLTEEDLIVE
ncbi:hypothetical protein BOQ60_25465, partial [Chryseobacterium sp. CH1]